MGSGDEVRQCKQRIFAGRLDFEYVRGRGRQPAGLKGRAKRRLIDDAAPRGVDQARGWLHSRQLRSSDQVAIRVDQRHVHGDEVGLFEQFGQADQRDVEQLRTLD